VVDGGGIGLLGFGDDDSVMNVLEFFADFRF
jgi:hypothetical protein